jgi:cysteinyl-tRNA synthetase
MDYLCDISSKTVFLAFNKELQIMSHKLFLYNTLTRKTEEFKAINAPNVGMYVCGPTVYGEVHLGHARPAIIFDILFRYLTFLGYKVRYVRNITDVGHLENDADEGEDKIAKKARLEQLEPMEIVQLYTENFHDCMKLLNCKSPSIEPRASGHIIEQQEFIKKIMNNGFAYESQGSIYFDVEAYHKKFNYGKLSGRVIDDLQNNTRNLSGQDEKHGSFDFALWKKAKPEHIMRWPSPWSDGFPGWHLECSAMAVKYLGETFDIHGGGMDLMFPHHECEIAQSVAALGKDSVHYWVHNNMITINGQKMGKSLGNFITLNQFFNGTSTILEKPYSPMAIRFFILQAHYRSTLDFSNEALQASEKGLERLTAAYLTLQKLSASTQSSINVSEYKSKCFDAMCDDLNSPIVLAHLFDAAKIINSVKAGTEFATQSDIDELKSLFDTFLIEILGIRIEQNNASNEGILSGIVNLLLTMRVEAKQNKDFASSDRIRNELQNLGVKVKDTKDGFEWEI